MPTNSSRPQVPRPAERARSLAARPGHAALLPSVPPDVLPHGMPVSHTETVRVRPLLHHVHADGTATVLLPDDHPLVAAIHLAPRGQHPTVLELADPAPVRLREPIRGLLWLTGWLHVPDPAEQRTAALAVAEERADPRLLDVGHGATLLRLTPVSLVLADAEGTAALTPDEFAGADPDPFCRVADHWLRHLEYGHPDVMGRLARHLPDRLRGGHIRPLGLDRMGLRLRVEAADGDHDVRLAFSRPVHSADELTGELRRLLGCPFLAAAGRRD